MFRKYALMGALVLALAPATARADWLFTPNIGTTFGADANGNEHFTYGASIGWMGAGIFGWEADLSYTPEFFSGNDNSFALADDNNVVSWMANAIIGIPFGGQRGGGFRPYVAVGAGVLQRQATSADSLFTIDNSEFGFNVGGGAMGFVSDHVGFRGDLRYMRSFEDPNEDNEFDIGVGNFDYWRGTAGVTFRW
jgi:hypothetical protein